MAAAGSHGPSSRGRHVEVGDRPKRPELRVLRTTAPVEPVDLGGLRVAPLPETLLACARDLGLLDLAVLLDSALRRPDCSRSDVEAFAGSGRWALRRCRERLPTPTPARSRPGRRCCASFTCWARCRSNRSSKVYDEGGVFVARADLRLSGTPVLHEYDGAVHRDRRTHVADLARDRRLVNSGWVRRGYTAGDLLGRSHLILREADQAVGRRHDPRRLRPWLEALSRSLFSSTGRARLLQRWKVVAEEPGCGR